VKVEFWFDFACPFAYLGSTQIEPLCARRKATLEWKPMLLGGLFRAIGSPETPAASMSPAKARHNARDFHRWAEHLGVPLHIPPGHPNRTVRALRALLALDPANWSAAIHSLYRAYWVDEQNVDDEAVVARALERAGIPAEGRARALAANADPAIRDELARRTDEAFRRGVFGAPTMFVWTSGEPLFFWGQDRLFMVDRALTGWRPKEGFA
jgi:2-hydroxychromene-2-carboxylate isomerase